MNDIGIRLTDNWIEPECLQEIIDLIKDDDTNKKIKEILENYEVKFYVNNK